MTKFPQFLTRGWPFCIYNPTVQPYQPRSWSCLLHSFMIPLFLFTSLINWTTSHYTGLSFPIGHFFASIGKTILVDSCHLSRVAADVICLCFSMVYGKCNYSNYCWEVTLASGYRPTLSDKHEMWTSAEHDLKTRINLSLHCLIYNPAIIADWPIKRITNEDSGQCNDWVRSNAASIALSVMFSLLLQMVARWACCSVVSVGPCRGEQNVKGKGLS